MDWVGAKAVAEELSVHKDALHIYAGVAIQVAAALVLRRRLGSWWPWLCVLLAELANEFLDIWLSDEAPFQQWQIVAAWHDLVNTMILPTAILLLCRFGPARLWGR